MVVACRESLQDNRPTEGAMVARWWRRFWRRNFRAERFRAMAARCSSVSAMGFIQFHWVAGAGAGAGSGSSRSSGSRGRSVRPARRRINFNVRVRVDRPAEWAEMFDDGWRTMKYRFYDPKMHGMDWDAMRAKYRPLVEFVGDRQELLNIINEMIGELNASHTGAAPPPRGPGAWWCCNCHISASNSSLTPLPDVIA